MVTFECPWCAEPAVVEASSFTELACEHCSISVEIAPDPVPSSLERAA
jgi:transcription elongation factor Elf1